MCVATFLDQAWFAIISRNEQSLFNSTFKETFKMVLFSLNHAPVFLIDLDGDFHMRCQEQIKYLNKNCKGELVLLAPATIST